MSASAPIHYRRGAEPLDAERQLFERLPDPLKDAFRIIRRGGESRARRMFLAVVYPERYAGGEYKPADDSSAKGQTPADPGGRNRPPCAPQIMRSTRAAEAAVAR